MEPTAQNAWHVTRGGKTYGPYTWEQIAEHAAGGRIGKADKILDPRTGAWTKPSQVSGLFGAGGVAAAPVGLSVAAKAIAVIAIAFAVALGGFAVFKYTTPQGHTRVVGDEEDGQSDADILPGIVDFAERDDYADPASATLPPEGLAFKGTFVWESLEGAGMPNLSHTDKCYLWMYTTDEGTMASFDFGEHLIDGWPVFLTRQSGSSYYVFESSPRSLVEKVRIVVDVSDTSMSGTVTKTNSVSSFHRGTFTGTAIPYEQYRAEVID